MADTRKVAIRTRFAPTPFNVAHYIPAASVLSIVVSSCASSDGWGPKCTEAYNSGGPVNASEEILPQPDLNFNTRTLKFSERFQGAGFRVRPHMERTCNYFNYRVRTGHPVVIDYMRTESLGVAAVDYHVLVLVDGFEADATVLSTVDGEFAPDPFDSSAATEILRLEDGVTNGVTVVVGSDQFDGVGWHDLRIVLLNDDLATGARPSPFGPASLSLGIEVVGEPDDEAVQRPQFEPPTLVGLAEVPRGWGRWAQNVGAFALNEDPDLFWWAAGSNRNGDAGDAVVLHATGGSVVESSFVRLPSQQSETPSSGILAAGVFAAPMPDSQVVVLRELATGVGPVRGGHGSPSTIATTPLSSERSP